jgi:tetratricopeptide (TPR) repeat protein
MSEDAKAPRLGVLIHRWLAKRLGVLGAAIVVALAVVLFAAWTQWHTVRTWPGIATVVDYLEQAPIPTADPERFSVLVAQLENDVDREHERLILALVREFTGIQVLSLDRTISIAGPDPADHEREGHARARDYLARSGGSVLIWGSVLRHAGETRPQLYMTTARDEPGGASQYLIDTSAEFRLPAVFWEHLGEVLRLLVASRDDEFRAEAGRFVADRLPIFVARVRALVAARDQQLGWDADAHANTQVILADALSILGEQSGRNKFLEEAVEAYHAALEEWTRERVPLNWAMTQNNLGSALLRLGERESGTARLEKAVEAYRAALEERTRERVPLDWAMTQNNLGSALLRLGERESGAARLEEAVEAYRAALEERTRERVPLDWAMTQNNLGTALATLGGRESGTARLDQAVDAYRAALDERSRDRVPLRWAMTQNNLGNALATLGEREGGTVRLEQAIAAHRAALEEFTRERVPLDWAMTQNNLGGALTRLGERESGTGRLEEAVEAYHAALEEWTRERVPLQWAMAQNNLGNALLALGQRDSDTARLEQAIAAYDPALEVFQEAGAGYHVERTRRNRELARAVRDRLAGGGGG